MSRPGEGALAAEAPPTAAPPPGDGFAQPGAPTGVRIGSPGRPAAGAVSIARVFVDGRNVQHALARDTGSSLPTIALVARLRAAFPRPTEIELILDGHPGRGPQGRVTPGLSVVFSKSATADQVIGNRVSEAFRELGAVDAYSVVVVSDDREIRDHARRNGVRVERTGWLRERMRTGGASTGIGLGRPPKPPRRTSEADPDLRRAKAQPGSKG